MGDNGKPERAQPHDSLVRNVLADTKLAADFLRNYLPRDWETRLEWDSLKQESGDTVDSTLSKLRSDLQYSARLKGSDKELDVLVVLEHQSRPDWFMSYRILDYVCAKFRQQFPSLKPGMRFPFPLAVVLHHGKTPWKKIPPMRDLIVMPEDITTDYFNVPIHLIDLAVIPVEELRGHPMVCALLDILQSASAGVLRDRFQQILARLHGVNRKQDALPWIEALFKYYVAVTGESKDTNIHEELAQGLNGFCNSKEEAGKMATTMLDAIKAEAQIQSVITFLKARFGEMPATLRNKLLKVRNEEHIEILLKQAATCQSLKDFQKAL